VENRSWPLPPATMSARRSLSDHLGERFPAQPDDHDHRGQAYRL